ncbi:coiled-coil domain-containing protein 63 [Agrilus planipennis]|uniref:Coiled-coil domain-containing protein 63 n=1 Tax=Agrilus planipennis TaxID=224129 RepID=A0A1W4X2J3_AGRPL|nr:coiled-coil domain-containing protein 63 [Agrilus planipennis]
MIDADDKEEMVLMAQNELSRLNRQYRIMEGDKTAFSEEAHVKLAKQRKVIKTLEKEQQNLLINLKVANSKIHKRKDLELTQKLNNLLKQHQKLSQEIFSEKSRLNEINSQIKKIDKKVFEMKSKEITDMQWQEQINEGQKIIKILEDKLSVAIKRYCSILAENQKLREDIDHLLKERTRYNSILEKLSTNLKSGKKFMVDLLEQAILAYDQREEWGTKLHELRHRLQIDNAIHTQEMRELQRRLDRDSKLKEFLTIKGQRRVMRDLENKEDRKKEQENEDREKQFELYNEILEKIQEFVGEKEVHKLIKCYVKQEEENFALFNYVNELNHELETLTENVSELNKKLANKAIFANDEENRVNEAEEELKALLNGVKELFDFLKCDIAPILNLLGENNTIDDCNVMLFVGLLDKRVAELTRILVYKETMMERKARAALNMLKKERIPFSNTNSPREL